jgi:hypothetical protein
MPLARVVSGSVSMPFRQSVMMFPLRRWCFLDACEVDVRLGRFIQLFIIAIALVSIPVWLFRTRGIRIFASIGRLLLLLFVAVLVVVNYLAEAVAVDWWAPLWLQE